MPAIDIDPQDRILLLDLPSAEALRSIALTACAGLVVAVGPDEGVRAARKAVADLDNVMLGGPARGRPPALAGRFLHEGVRSTQFGK